MAEKKSAQKKYRVIVKCVRKKKIQKPNVSRKTQSAGGSVRRIMSQQKGVDIL